MPDTPPHDSPPQQAAPKCPYCGSYRVRPSSRRSSGKAHVRYRCESCKRHFKTVPVRWRAIMLVASGLLVVALVSLGLYLGRSSPLDYPAPADTLHEDVLAGKREAAARGNPQAQFDLGHALWKRGDYKDGLPWIERAAKAGHVDAEFLLGMAYLSGRGTLQNYRAALEHFQIAARHGHLEGQYQLGLLYREGLAAQRDKEAAYLWLNIAAAHGHEQALADRDRLALNMTTEQVTRAQEASARESAAIAARLTGDPAQRPAADGN
jgi:TPR repeat protein/DNA-directed RNA polymerase subunit RPC12/RpoP